MRLKVDWMDSPPKSGTAETSVKLADLFSKVSELAKLEDEEVGRAVGMVVPVLSWLNEPVPLHPESLGETFRDVAAASLQVGAVVFMTDRAGRGHSRALAKFSVEDCLAILQDCIPELQRLVADKRRAGQVRPSLSLRMALGGSRFIIDMRSYRLKLYNSGGPCRSIRVTGSYPGGRTKTLDCVDLGTEERAELDLRVFREVQGRSHMELSIECEDVDGRGLEAAEPVRMDGEWQMVALRRI